MPPPLPRCSGWGYASLILPSRISLPRQECRVGLHIVLFEACSTFTRVAACPLALSPIRDTLIEGFSHLVTSMTAPIASGGSDFAGWGLHPLESAALPRPTPIAVILPRQENRVADWEQQILCNRKLLMFPIHGSANVRSAPPWRFIEVDAERGFANYLVSQRGVRRMEAAATNIPREALQLVRTKHAGSRDQAGVSARPSLTDPEPSTQGSRGHNP
jgi:hypothetical protein